MPTETMDSEFMRICELEPRLWALYQEAVSLEPGPDFCALEAWYKPGGFKERLKKLVGWEAENLDLVSEDAYAIAYETISAALPDCQHTEPNGWCYY